MSIKLNPTFKRNTRKNQGPLQVPGDKSISHRALLFGAIANGTTSISNLLESGDSYSTQLSLKALGIQVIKSHDKILVVGAGKHGLKPPTDKINCGNSGTTLRLLMGLLAGQPFSAQIFGDESLSKRPMKRIRDPLQLMGAQIDLSPQGTAPLSIQGTYPLKAIDYSLPLASAQIKGALLLASLYAEGESTLSGKLGSRDHSERLLKFFGCNLISTVTNNITTQISIDSNHTLEARTIQVPGDFSSAAFWIALGTLIPGEKLEFTNILLNPTRTGILTILKRMGAQIETQITSESPEPVGTLTVHYAELKGTEILPDELPFLIDEVPLLAILATFAHGKTTLHGAEELRVKESDRLEAIATNLRKMGAKIDLFPDGFSIEGPQNLVGAQIESFEDHRIAMAFSIAALKATGSSEILKSDCVSISYPRFYETLHSLL